MHNLNLDSNDSMYLENVVRRVAAEGGSNRLPVLLTLIQKNMDRYDRKPLLIRIVDAIHELRLFEAAPALVRMMIRTSAFEVQKKVLLALKNLPHPENIPVLEKLVSDREKLSFIRMGALEALEPIEGGETIRAMARLVYKLEERGEHEYFQRVKACLRRKGDAAAGVLIEDLNAPDPLLKLYAAKALGDLGHKGAIPSLRKIVEEKSGHVSKVAAESALLLYLS